MKHRVDVIYPNTLWADFHSLWKHVTFNFQNNLVNFGLPVELRELEEQN